MKKSNHRFLITALFLVATILPGLSQDSEETAFKGISHRGDPPYLIESGWIPLLNGINMDGWEYVPKTGQGGWTATPAVIWDEPDGPANLQEAYISGDRIVNTIDPSKKMASDIFTTRKFGDQEIYLEFLVASTSNSGVYVHGLYEIQIVNSYGKDSASTGAICGSVYHFAQQVNDEWVGGVPPMVRAERPHGHWQSLHILFKAPKFDTDGNKISNAEFIQVLHNGILIHENVERKGPTRACMKIDEAAENPLMLQGNHGTIAYRNIYVRPLSNQ